MMDKNFNLQLKKGNVVKYNVIENKITKRW